MRQVLKIPNGKTKMKEAGVSLLALGQAHPVQDPALAVFLSPEGSSEEDAGVTWRKRDAAEAEREIPKILCSRGTGLRFPNPPASVVCLELQIFLCPNLLKL